MENSRKVYRVDLGSSPCTVEARFGGGVTRGTGLDLSAKGLGATFPCEPSDLLPLVGEVGQIVIAGEWLKQSLHLQARAVRRSDIGADICSFGFEFVAELDEVNPELRRLFNRRQAVRVRPPTTEPVEVVVAIPPAIREAAVMRDISSTGIGLEVGVMTQRHIGSKSKVELLFSLPSAGEELAVPATIRHRHYIGGSKIVMGLTFLLAQSAPEVQRAIDDYVMTLQRKLLSNAARLRD